MNFTEQDMKFWIYEAKITKEFRQKCKANNITISEIMAEIDDDSIVIREEKSQKWPVPVTREKWGKTLTRCRKNTKSAFRDTNFCACAERRMQLKR